MIVSGQDQRRYVYIVIKDLRSLTAFEHGIIHVIRLKIVRTLAHNKCWDKSIKGKKKQNIRYYKIHVYA